MKIISTVITEATDSGAVAELLLAEKEEPEPKEYLRLRVQVTTGKYPHLAELQLAALLRARDEADQLCKEIQRAQGRPL